MTDGTRDTPPEPDEREAAARGAAPGPPPEQPGGSSEPSNGDRSMGELVLEISDQATALIREEIELAKTELSEKANRLLAGSVAGIVAGVFLLAALILLMHFFAILLGENVFGGRVWLGYLIEAIIFIGIAAGAGLYAYRSIKRGTPPTPEMAIEEAKEIRAAFESSETGEASR